jgi:hypothetical protein
MIEMGGEETPANHLHAGVRRLDDDLLEGQVLADKDVDVTLSLRALVTHGFLRFEVSRFHTPILLRFLAVVK